MSKVATNISIDSDVKTKAQIMLSDFGLDLSTAINMFLRQMLRERRIPFEISQNTPNAETLAAFAEVEDMKKHPDRYKSYDNIDKMFEDLLS